jgi:hypothetical protein
MMQSAMGSNPMLIQKLMQMRQNMQPPQNTPVNSPGQGISMLNNQQPMAQPGMQMGAPSPGIMQQLMARRKAMMMNQPMGNDGMSMQGSGPMGKPGMSPLTPTGDPRMSM